MAISLPVNSPGEMSNRSSNLNIAYGKGTIEEAGWLNLTERYVGSMEIEKSQALLLDSKYSKLALGETSSMVGESKYDNIRIE